LRIVINKIMELPSHIADAILSAESKALATIGKHGLNVVPVSTVRVVDGQIWLMNYFFKKTRENIMEQPRAALVCWKGFEGYQIKGSVEYAESGDTFEKAKAWVTEHVPNRVLKGLFIIEPEETYRVSPSPN